MNFPDPADAMSRIAGLIHRTPILQSRSLDRVARLRLVFKCEHLQRTGSFKFRGASLAVSKLAQDCRGVVTHSSGNHGAALAAAAAMRGLRAEVVMPKNAVADKIDAVRAYGGTVHFCQPTQAAREAGLSELVKLGYTPVPPYDHDDIIAGQGTAALEFLAQCPDLDCLVAPIGGGGLLSGTALAAARACPSVRVFGAEPEGADDARRSLLEGRRVKQHRPETIADGLRALIGKRNFDILSHFSTPILPVSEQQIIEAMKLIWRHLKQVVEPSGAVAFAAALAHHRQFEGQRVGIVLSGGNLAVGAMLQQLEAANVP